MVEDLELITRLKDLSKSPEWQEIRGELLNEAVRKYALNGKEGPAPGILSTIKIVDDWIENFKRKHASSN